MIAIVFYVFGAFGLAYIVGHSTITLPFREEMSKWMVIRRFVDLVECPACFGFWTGVAAVIFGAVPFPAYGIFGAISWGLFTAGTNYVIAKSTHLI